MHFSLRSESKKKKNQDHLVYFIIIRKQYLSYENNNIKN